MGALIFGLVSVALFAVVAAAFGGFLGNAVVPWRIDGPPGPLGVAGSLAVDALLLAVFCAHHSVMARPAVKRALQAVLPPSIERSAYVLVSTLLLAALVTGWQPVPDPVWRITHPAAVALLGALSIGGLALMAAGALALDGLALAGLRQVICHARGRPMPPMRFATPGPYRWVRHPIMAGFLLVFWAVPTMSGGHLLLSAFFTAYIVLATLRLEEPDLRASLGQAYADYQRRVPALLPWPRRPGR